jgi:hypothetical protein
MKHSQITTLLSSQRLIGATQRFMLWSRLSSMVASYPRLARAEMNAHKSETARKVVTQFEQTRSEFWSIYAEASSRGLEYDIAEELDRMTTTARKPTPLAQLEQLAQATGLPLSTLKANMEQSRMKALGVAMETRTALEATIYEGEFSNVDEELDPEVSAELVDQQAEKLVLWLATWSKPDYAELMIIKTDREYILQQCEKEENQDTTPGIDEQAQAEANGARRAFHLMTREA